MKKIFEKLKKKFRKEAMQNTASSDMLHQLMHMAEATQETEYSCDDVYNILDEYTEAVARGEDAARMMPLVKHHLDMCPDCREEFEALLRVLDQKAA